MYSEARQFINGKNYSDAYNLLKDIKDKCAEWYYLMGVSSLKLGYYEQGEDYINKAHVMEPENQEYNDIVSKFSRYHKDYNHRAHGYHKRRRNDLDCCCCDDCCCCCCDDCCCGDDFCECIGQLWCLDSMCECFGGDLCDCM